MSERREHSVVNRIIRDLLSSDSEQVRGEASAWLLAAVQHVLRLDEDLDPDTVTTVQGRRACAMAIADLREAYDYYARTTEQCRDDPAEFLLH
jgi:hypothetical protein